MTQIGSPVRGGASQNTNWQPAFAQSTQQRRHIKRSADRVAGLSVGQLEIEDFVRRQAAARAVQPDAGRSVLPKLLANSFVMSRHRVDSRRQQFIYSESAEFAALEPCLEFRGGPQSQRRP
jgi:hypothetical protein